MRQVQPETLQKNSIFSSCLQNITRDLNIFFQIKMKQCSVADTKTGGVLCGVIFKLDIL
jgi:hypothetical protein